MRRSSSAARSLARFSSPASASRASDQAMQRRAEARLLVAQRRQRRRRRSPAAAPPRLARGCARRLRAGPPRAACCASANGASCSRQAISRASASWRRMSCAEIAIAGRLPRLAFQAVDLGVDLLEHVLQTQEIVFGALEPEFGLVAARMQAGDAGGLFQDQPARLRLGGDDLADLALAHHAPASARRSKRRRTAAARRARAPRGR